MKRWLTAGIVLAVLALVSDASAFDDKLKGFQFGVGGGLGVISNGLRGESGSSLLAAMNLKAGYGLTNHVALTTEINFLIHEVDYGVYDDEGNWETISSTTEDNTCVTVGPTFYLLTGRHMLYIGTSVGLAERGVLHSNTVDDRTYFDSATDLGLDLHAHAGYRVRENTALELSVDYEQFEGSREGQNPPVDYHSVATAVGVSFLLF